MGMHHTTENPQQWLVRQEAASFAFQAASLGADLQRWISAQPNEDEVSDEIRTAVALIQRATAELGAVASRPGTTVQPRRMKEPAGPAD